jgi:hypothetical protein
LLLQVAANQTPLVVSFRLIDVLAYYVTTLGGGGGGGAANVALAPRVGLLAALTSCHTGAVTRFRTLLHAHADRVKCTCATS